MRKKVKEITDLQTKKLSEKKKQQFLQELETNPLALEKACYQIRDDKELTLKEQQKELRNKIYNCMEERSENSNIEHIKYIKKVIINFTNSDTNIQIKK